MEFNQLNLATDIFPSPANLTAEMDIIFLRNVLIYFDQKMRHTIISKLRNCLKENGIFITSPSELSLIDLPDLHCRRLQCGVMVFQKKRAMVKTTQHVFSPSAVKSPGIRSVKVIQAKASRKLPAKLLSKKKPEDALCKKYLADFERGNYAKIINELLPIISSGKRCGDLTEIEAMFLLAEAYANSGNLQDALKWGSEVIKKDKITPSHYFFLATLHVELEQPAEAAQFLNKCIFLDHDFIMAYFILATILPPAKAGKHLANTESILHQMENSDIVPYSSGMNVGHLLEIISSMRKQYE